MNWKYYVFKEQIGSEDQEFFDKEADYVITYVRSCSEGSVVITDTAYPCIWSTDFVEHVFYKDGTVEKSADTDMCPYYSEYYVGEITEEEYMRLMHEAAGADEKVLS